MGVKDRETRFVERLHGVQLIGQSSLSSSSCDNNNGGEVRLSEFSQLTCQGEETVGVNQRLQFQQLWQQRPSCFRPVQCSLNCDKHIGETIANVVTSIPFIVLGLQTPRKNLNMKLYANSLIGVGIASSLYHTSRGKIRKYLKWADYTMIATTTLCLSRALREENPKVIMAASTLLLPFQPIMVSAIHTGMMEVSFAKKASVKPELKTAHSVHKMSGILSGALFVLDDCYPEIPYIHAAWHLAAAIGVVTCNKLLE
ncbi:hypothetical protein LUZ60_003120 [Juncus effusus]|nr:hypothetical protein LUZ60_003120 [Juncus effusus]